MDGRTLVDAKTGVGTYARSLHAAIHRHSPEPGLIVDRTPSDRIPPAPFGRAGRIARALWPRMRHATRDPDVDGERRYRVPDVFRLAQVFFDVHGRTLPIRLPGRAGIAHWSYPLPMHIAGWTNVYTIHDLIPLTHPGLSPIDAPRHLRLLQAVRRVAAGVVTVSETSRAEIEIEFGANTPSIVDCGQSVDMRGDLAALPEGLGPRGFFLVLGSVERRKNIPAIVSAHQASGTRLPLVIAGPDGWNAGAAQAIGGPNVIRLSDLAGESVRTLVGHARALIMVSLAEGFGLPVAEAMTLGTPVITSDCGALAETAGGAAVLVNPGDVAALARGIADLANDDTHWHRLSRAGLARAEAFSPQRFATRLGEFYRRLIGAEGHEMPTRPI